MARGQRVEQTRLSVEETRDLCGVRDDDENRLPFIAPFEGLERAERRPIERVNAEAVECVRAKRDDAATRDGLCGLLVRLYVVLSDVGISLRCASILI